MNVLMFPLATLLSPLFSYRRAFWSCLVSYFLFLFSFLLPLMFNHCPIPIALQTSPHILFSYVCSQDLLGDLGIFDPTPYYLTVGVNTYIPSGFISSLGHYRLATPVVLTFYRLLSLWLLAVRCYAVGLVDLTGPEHLIYGPLWLFFRVMEAEFKKRNSRCDLFMSAWVHEYVRSWIVEYTSVACSLVRKSVRIKIWEMASEMSFGGEK